MAKSKTTFKPGQSGNPAGRPKLPEDIRKAAKLTNEQFIKLTSEFLLMDRAEIQSRLQNQNASMLELLVGGIVAKAAKDHDHMRAEWLIARTIGKMKESLEVVSKPVMTVKRRDGTEVILGSVALDKDENNDAPF